MSDPGTTAQVHPYLFTTSMLELAKERGVQLVQGTAISVERVDR
jgi:glycine/D-amino acid oxidase-like deaminating enzyme